MGLIYLLNEHTIVLMLGLIGEVLGDVVGSLHYPATPAATFE